MSDDPKNKKPLRSAAWFDAPGREGIRVGELEVRGDVVVQPAGDKLLLINVLSLEDSQNEMVVRAGDAPLLFTLGTGMEIFLAAPDRRRPFLPLIAVYQPGAKMRDWSSTMAASSSSASSPGRWGRPAGSPGPEFGSTGPSCGRP